jgi:hypothetical protein
MNAALLMSLVLVAGTAPVQDGKPSPCPSPEASPSSAASSKAAAPTLDRLKAALDAEAARRKTAGDAKKPDATKSKPDAKPSPCAVASPKS